MHVLPDNSDIIDELLEDNEDLENILGERTEDLIDALWRIVDTQEELLNVYRSCLEPEEEYPEDETKDKPVSN